MAAELLTSAFTILPSAIFAELTALLLIVVAMAPVPEPVTSDESVMVWSPVLVPLKLAPVTLPVAATEDGVMAPKVNDIAGVVVGLDTAPDTPLAVATETEVTEPPASLVRLLNWKTLLVPS